MIHSPINMSPIDIRNASKMSRVVDRLPSQLTTSLAIIWTVSCQLTAPLLAEEEREVFGLVENINYLLNTTSGLGLCGSASTEIEGRHVRATERVFVECLCFLHVAPSPWNFDDGSPRVPLRFCIDEGNLNESDQQDLNRLVMLTKHLYLSGIRSTYLAQSELGDLQPDEGCCLVECDIASLR